MKRSPTILTASDSGPLSDLVRDARALARQIVLEGVDHKCPVNTPLESYVKALLHVKELLGDTPRQLTDEQIKKSVDDALHAAYAIGIAVGLLLRPNAFAKGGAR
jgi:hypothetical protein